MFDAGMIFCCDSYVLGARLLCEIFSAPLEVIDLLFQFFIASFFSFVELFFFLDFRSLLLLP
jgi:hypothetical protein